jgi:hypothetical protein
MTTTPQIDYKTWRIQAEVRLKQLEICKWGHEQELREIERRIQDLTETMANGASNGTAWQRNIPNAYD